MSEVLGSTCIDGGTCHHECANAERCFRRAFCAPFSDYKGPWRLSQPPASQAAPESPAVRPLGAWTGVPLDERAIATARVVFGALSDHELARFEDALKAYVYFASIGSPAASPQGFKWPRLDRQARVGNGTFGIGVSTRLVVDAATRLFDADGRRDALTGDEFRRIERDRRRLWDMVHGTLDLDPVVTADGAGLDTDGGARG